jgi:hypothetical protein
MSDLFGLMSLPVAVPAAGAAVSDPALDVVLAFMQAVLNSDLGDAWAAVCPGDPLPVAYVFNHNPDLESFNANETPALYMWRSDDGGAGRYSQDLIADESGFQCLWVPPPAEQEDRRKREAIRNGIKKSLRAAFAQGRHPAWVVAGDTYYDPTDYGSVLLYHAKISRIRLGAFRAHELVIESEDKSFKQVFDALFFGLETLEFLSVDPVGKTGFPTLDHLQGTTTLAARNDTGLDEGATLSLVSPGQTLTLHIELAVTSLTPATGPAAGGTDVTISGVQFIEGMVVEFGTEPSLLVQYVDESTIIARSPAHDAGIVPVTVTQAVGGVAKTLAGSFTFT